MPIFLLIYLLGCTIPILTFRSLIHFECIFVYGARKCSSFILSQVVDQFSQWFLKKLEIELPYDPAIPLLSIHTEETRYERDTCTPVFIAALFIIARTWKQPRYPSADEWIRKLWYIYTMEYYSAIKKFIWISSKEMDETGAHYTEWSKPER